jgi:hypothetical protein
MRTHLVPVLLAIAGLMHVALLVAIVVLGRTRPATSGDIAALVVFAALYLVAAGALAQGRRWGRWLALAASGVEAVPAAVLLYVLAVYSGDPASRTSSGQVGFMALLSVPIVLFIVVWRHPLTKQDRK